MDLQDLLSRLKEVKSSGAGYTARCPGHDDQKNSLSIDRGDDGRLLLNCHAGCDKKQIIEAMGITLRDLFNDDKPSNAIVAIYPYPDENGKVLYEKVRFAPKEFIHRVPLGNGKYKTKRAMEGVRRVIFRLDKIAQEHPDRVIFIVEGEKDVLTMESHGFVATTNSEGAGDKKWKREYTEQLSKFSNIVILPDQDWEGHRHAIYLKKQFPNAQVIHLPGFELREKHGQDVSDWFALGHTAEELMALVESGTDHDIPEPPKKQPKQPNQPKQAATPTPAPTAPTPKGLYTSLGYSGEKFYFFPHSTKQVAKFSASALGQVPNLLCLAPLQYWETSFQDGDGRFSKNAAVDYLLRESQSVGIFDAERIRGRGAWHDAGRIVLHRGDGLIVDGEPVELGKLDTNYIYERNTQLSLPHERPISREQAEPFVTLCNGLAWENPLAGRLLAGWIALAPICGVLRWRPHIWITAPAGSGKSWVLENVVGMLGRSVMKVQSCTTEAGLRQAVKADAISVLFDEAEMDSAGSMMKMQKIIELARQASSENDARIFKGTSSGDALHYIFRGMFCMSSIGVGVQQRADETRFTVLELERPPGGTHFRGIKMLAEQVCTETFASGLIARSVSMARVIRANVDTFSTAVAARVGSQRLADQIGTLLAGYWSLWSDSEISEEECVRYVSELPLEGLLPANETSDEVRCLQFLLEQRVKVNFSLGDKPNYVDLNIGEIIEAGKFDSSLPTRDIAQDILLRMGIRADLAEGLYVSNTHNGIARLLYGQHWGTKWSMFLKRLHGARATPNPIRFGVTRSRATLIPWRTVFDPERGDVADSGSEPVSEEIEEHLF